MVQLELSHPGQPTQASVSVLLTRRFPLKDLCCCFYIYTHFIDTHKIVQSTSYTINFIKVNNKSKETVCRLSFIFLNTTKWPSFHFSFHMQCNSSYNSSPEVGFGKEIPRVLTTAIEGNQYWFWPQYLTHSFAHGRCEINAHMNTQLQLYFLCKESL